MTADRFKELFELGILGAFGVRSVLFDADLLGVFEILQKHRFFLGQFHIHHLAHSMNKIPPSIRKRRDSSKFGILFFVHFAKIQQRIAVKSDPKADAAFVAYPVFV